MPAQTFTSAMRSPIHASNHAILARSSNRPTAGWSSQSSRRPRGLPATIVLGRVAPLLWPSPAGPQGFGAKSHDFSHAGPQVSHLRLLPCVHPWRRCREFSRKAHRETSLLAPKSSLRQRRGASRVHLGEVRPPRSHLRIAAPFHITAKKESAG